MVFSPGRHADQQADFRIHLEANYRNRSLVQLPAGSTVPQIKGNYWLVVRGMVRLQAITYHGDEVLLGIAGPGEPFGDPLQAVEASDAVSLCSTDLLCLTSQELRDDPTLALGMLEAVTRRLRQSERLLALMALRRVEERVKGFLELLASDYGQPCPEGLRLGVRLTHHELACAVGTTRVTVTRVLGQLKEQGWLLVDAQRCLVVAHLPRPR
ncbi:MAG: Crp/Fnr family transcriptional regulator [Cyanobacteriota bacterium]|nr:Crp/Fnr family transcriptional regulator [Cyanobacteriota bacterium]